MTKHEIEITTENSTISATAYGEIEDMGIGDFEMAGKPCYDSHPSFVIDRIEIDGVEVSPETFDAWDAAGLITKAEADIADRILNGCR